MELFSTMGCRTANGADCNFEESYVKNIRAVIDNGTLYDDMVSAARFAACGASLSTLHAGASGHKLEEKEIRDYMDEPRKSSVEADPNPAPGLASGTCMED